MKSVREMEAVSTAEPKGHHRRKLQDKHHTFWPRRHYVTRTEREFRSLNCALATIDFEAHKAFHYSLEPLKKPSQRAMQIAVRRHKQRRCSCADRSTRISINLLQLAGSEQYVPCLRIDLDPWMAKLMEMRFRWTRVPREIPADWIDFLQNRHDLSICGCSKPSLTVVQNRHEPALT